MNWSAMIHPRLRVGVLQASLQDKVSVVLLCLLLLSLILDLAACLACDCLAPFACHACLVCVCHARCPCHAGLACLPCLFVHCSLRCHCRLACSLSLPLSLLAHLSLARSYFLTDRGQGCAGSQVNKDPSLDCPLDDLTLYELEHCVLRLSDSVREGSSERRATESRMSLQRRASVPFPAVKTLHWGRRNSLQKARPS